MARGYAGLLSISLFFGLCRAEIIHSRSWGRSGIQRATGAVSDAGGNTYIVGLTDSTDLFARPLSPLAGGTDAFLIKIDPAWNEVFTTYIGGRDFDEAKCVGTDATGNIYIGGATRSDRLAGVPVAGGTSGKTGFIAKLNPSGTQVLYVKTIGDSVNSIAVTPDGKVVAAGHTGSQNLPVQQAVQERLRGIQNGFVARFDAAGTLVFCTYIGGAGTDTITGIAIDATAAVWAVGSTTSIDFPLVAPVQSQLRGIQNPFVLRLSADNRIVFSTFFGGSMGTVTSPEQANAVSLDSAGNAYVAGVTSSMDFPVVNAWQSKFKGWDSDAFLSSFTPTGVVRFSTYVGGSRSDHANAVAVMDDDSIMLSGNSYSADFPQTSGTTQCGNLCGFVAQFSNDGAVLLQSTYVAQGASDTVEAITGSNPVVVVGLTSTTDPPQTVQAAAAAVSVQHLVSLEVTVSPAGAGNVVATPASTSGRYIAGTRVCLKVEPMAGWSFSGWTAGGKAIPECLRLDETLSVVASFTRSPGTNFGVDFNRDGYPDLVWQNDLTRQVTVSYMGGAQGSTLLGGNWLVSMPQPGWTVAGIGDFNRDGYPDLVWQNDLTRQVTVNYMGGAQGSTLLGGNWLVSMPQPGWTMVVR